MKTIYKKLMISARLWVLLPLLFVTAAQAQVLVPSSGSNTIACGTSTTLMDHAGTGNYANNASGYTVIDAGFNAVITINGTYDTESWFDYIYLYDGAGTGGTMLGSWDGFGTISYTGTPGQTLTVQFDTDGSVVYPGFSLNVTYSGACFATPCSTNPPANSVVGPTAGICPGASVFLGMANSYTVGDLAFQWQAATQSSVGPWTNVSGGSSSYMTAPLTSNTWYQVIVTCTNVSMSTTSGPVLVQVQGVTVDSIPYFEGFEGITGNDELPNCSWSVDNLGSEAFTYTVPSWDNRIPRTGNNFASFYYWPGNTNSFYTNGIYMKAGVTYSASVWYVTNLYGDNNWEDISILAGPNQSPTGQFVIASTPGPAISSVYKSLSNTFTVATTGVYYIAVRTTVNTNQYAPYLSWDDLAITAPCSLNTPVLNVSTNTGTVCAGAAVSIMAAGVHNYSWNTGDNTSVITVYPMNNQLYTVTGTSTLTGCSVTKSQYITVNPVPFVAIVADKQRVCEGSPVNLTALGDASSYNWSVPGASGNFATYVPVSSGTVSVIGNNAFGCTASAAVNITVMPNPSVNGTATPSTICVGENATLQADGALTYKWMTSSTYMQSNPATVSPVVSTAYSVTGTDQNGCTSAPMTVNVQVEECTGLAEQRISGGVKVYPNPSNGLFTIAAQGKAFVTISDVSGRQVAEIKGGGEFDINISELANGIYCVKVMTGTGLSTVRIVKE